MNKKQALKLISELKQELIIRKERYAYNQFAGVCKNSLFHQKKIIFELEQEI